MADTGESDALPKALIVDDEREVADAYALRLRERCDVETVYSGEAAIRRMDDDEFDVVLLDRHMPGMSGDEVLNRLDERGYEGRVIMVTAIDPGFDVLDMPFDDYLCKPVEREDIRAAVEQQCTILGYRLLGEYFSAESKRQVLEAELTPEARAERREYREVVDRAERIAGRVRRLVDSADELFNTFEAIEREGR